MKRCHSPITLPLFDSAPIIESGKPIGLRPYQEKAIDAARTLYREGKRRILMVAPCGAGKMFILAAITRSSSVVTLYAAHRIELIDQCVRELQAQGLRSIGVIRGDDERTNPDATIQVSSIDTLRNRELPWKPGLILIDEAHRSAAESYKTCIFDKYPDATILGWTASPTRMNGDPLGNRYESLYVVATYDELFRQNWLVVPDVFGAPKAPDLSHVQMLGDDYEQSGLALVMSADDLVGQTVEHWLALADKYPIVKNGHRVTGQVRQGAYRKTLFFGVDIEHSMSVRDRFLAAGVRAAHLDGDSDPDERRETLRALREGDLQVVCNCNLFLEGLDVPEVKCVVHGRPTKSLTLWIQSGSRLGRPWCSACRKKPQDCGHPSDVPLLLDHANNLAEHGAPFEDRHWSLTQRARRMQGSSAATKVCPDCQMSVASGRVLCPNCSHEFPQAARKEPTESREKLQQYSTDPSEMRRFRYEKFVTKARGAGFKPGWASYQFKKAYGDWPPYEWGEVTKASCASDPYWQARIAAREAGREAKERAKGSATVVDGGRPVEPVNTEPEAYVEPFDEPDSLNAWLRGEGVI